MDTILKSPESILCTQHEEITKENDEIYFIAKGKCRVLVKEKFTERTEEMKVAELNPGSHFGEVSMLYNCNRSATVQASYYLTCAKINRQNYNELLQIYPSLNARFKDQIAFYTDPVKMFLEMSLNQIDYFRPLKRHIKAEWIFNMKVR